MQHAQLERALLGAVADIVLEERSVRTAADQALEHRIDDYGNVIERRFGELEERLEARLARAAAELEAPAGPPGVAGPAGPPGPPGPAGAAWTHRRHYDPAEHYRAGDVVAQDGGSSIALVDEPGPCPGDGWAALTLRGKPGQRGERGPAGVSPVALELAGGVLVLKLSDGTSLSCELEPRAELEPEADRAAA